MSQAPQTPALSVILPCEEGFAFIRRTVRALHAQTVRDRIELVIVAPTDGPGIEPREVGGFHSVRTVVAPGKLGNRARAAGIRAAIAPVVALAEDHCFPEPGWAAALIAAHEQGWTAVGPAMYNANPATSLSWVNLLLAFGPWVGPAAAGPMTLLPWHNSAYKRAPLLEYGDDLGDMMEVESVLQWDLVRKGHRFYQETAAKTHHLNISRPASTIVHRPKAGRLFAGHRSRGWSPLKRLVYIVAAPLIPWVRLWRTLSMMRKAAEWRGLMPRILPVLLGCLVLDTIGETAGYAAGPGNVAREIEAFEHQRYRHLTRADQQAYDAEDAASRQPA